MRRGFTVEEIHARSMIDPWFLRNLEEIVHAEWELTGVSEQERTAVLLSAKRMGFSDHRLAELWNIPEAEVRQMRADAGVTPVFKRVDTCGA